MCLVLLHLSLACLALLSSGADGEPLQVLSAPNLLRIGSAENIFVECQECTGVPVNVKINVKNHPTKSQILASTSVTLSSGNNFQDFGQITIPAGDFKKDPNLKQYVYLQAQFPGHLLEKVVLVSFQSGYIFIQTDKSLYTPGSKVYYRMFAVTPGMEPIERNDQGPAIINIEIVTPEGLILPEDPVSLNSGIYSGYYKLPEIVSPGVWKVVSKFNSNPQHSYSVEFEVKEYVLPSFEVKLTISDGRNFFYVDDNELRVEIEATYLFGKEVEGTAYVMFGVIQDDLKRSFPTSLQRVVITSGKGMAILRREHITQTFGDVERLLKTSIYVSVSVLTDTGSDLVESEKRGIQIVTSPYTIHFKKTPKYFKPGMYLEVEVEVVVHVVNPDDTPAHGIQVVVNPGNVEGITSENGIARISINPRQNIEHLDITAKTNVPGIRPDRQASASMRALPYATTTNNYLHIGVDASEVKLGDNLKIYIYGQQNVNRHLTFLIQSRGQLVKHFHYKTEGGVSIVQQQITKQMLPSFRIIAYYHVGVSEVVSDSVWVDVVDTCMGLLKLESTRNSNSFEPRKIFGLKITGNPGAIVGLVAVDKGVYNKNRLTMTKVWDVVEKYDTGCTPGGGKDSMGVFYDAGLLFETNTASGTPYRLELKCPVSARRKRSFFRPVNTGPGLLEVRTTLLSQYTDKLQRQCCLDGMKEIPLTYSCDRRSEYIMDGGACVEAFLRCCKTAEQQKGEEDYSFLDNDDILSRTKFPESWLWNDVTLPNCPDGTTNCTTTSLVRNVPLPDLITTWQLTGISLSRTHGICIDDTLKIIMQKEFFIDLRLPYSAVHGEQIEIKAIIHNYQEYQIKVRVFLIENENMCSSASKRGKFSQTINIAPMTTRSVPFVIIPMNNGDFPIAVKAAVHDSYLSDGIMRILRVVPRGILQMKSMNIILDPLKHDGKQMETIWSQIPMTDIAPKMPTTTVVSVTGGAMSPLVENVLNGSSVIHMIQLPAGNGEENMARMMLPIIATIYLDKTNQWKKVGFEKRDEAIKQIKTGYQNQIAYRQSTGAFAVFQNHPPSSWLTSYVVKVFAMAHNLVHVQEEVLCGAIRWLILNSQLPDGSFKEVGTLRYHADMMGDVPGLDTDASMTAFTLIAMQEARGLCEEVYIFLPQSIDKASRYLEAHLSTLTNPYSVAMVSYALANENKFNKDILMRSSRGSTHWPVSGSPIHTLEATAYALLALVNVQAFEEASPIVKWFNTQRFVDGGYGSTQATIIVYQAIAEYWTKANEQQYEMEVEIDLPHQSDRHHFRFNTDNTFTTRSAKFNDISKDVNVTATGSGQAILMVTSFYYALPKQQLHDCQEFNFSVKLQPVRLAEGENIYMLRIEVLYMNMNRDAGMTILDIGLPTGYTADVNDLNALSHGRDRTISKYDMNTNLSERGSLIIYLDKVSHTRPDEVAFRIRQTVKVGVIQPAAVSVYEYYDRRPCVTFYHPGREQGQLLRLCQNDECRCAEEECSMQQKGKINPNERTAKACEVGHDFVYKVRVENMEFDSITDIYKMRILDVIKEGSKDLGVQGKLRDFLSYSNCRASLSLKKDKTYLIMGSSQDFERFYVLGERTWVEYWPTAEECQSDAFRATCIGMEELVTTLTIFGCDYIG